MVGSKRSFSRSNVGEDHTPILKCQYPGASGIDGTKLLPKATFPPIREKNAIVAMRTALMTQPKGTPWLVATGALTNVALLFATFPEVATHIKGLSIMGGAIGAGFSQAPMGYVRGEGERIGNATSWAEFNIYVRICPVLISNSPRPE